MSGHRHTSEYRHMSGSNTLIIVISLFMALILSSTYTSAYVKTYKDVMDNIGSGREAHVMIVIDTETSYERNYGESYDGSYEKIPDDVMISGSNDDNGFKDNSVSRSKSRSRISKDLSDVDGFTKHRALGSINGYAGILTAEGLANLEDSGLDLIIYDDTPFTILDHTILGDDMASEASTLYSQLNVSTAAVKADYSWNVLNITGRGIDVGVIDTGIEYTHPDLGGCFGNGTNDSCKVYDGYDFINDDPDPIDDNGHGTHVSGILAANGTIRGVAPEATLYAYKACDSGGMCQPSVIILAMDRAKNDSVDVLSISLGVWTGDVIEGSSGYNLMSQEAKILTDAGMVVVVAAGNGGPGVSTIFAPADSKDVISVGAVEDNGTASTNDDIVWNQSSRGPSLSGRLDPELVAPGYLINSTFMGGEYTYNYAGTSMAAPFVSGAAALLLESYPSLTNTQIKAMLMQSASSISGKVFAKGSGELDIMNALTGRIYASVNQTDTYGHNSISDRWEFVVLSSTTAHANITLFNDNDYNISFNTSLENIISMEHDDAWLNTSLLGMPLRINITANSSYTFEVNFTLTNFSSAYAATYGGMILLEGSGYNGTGGVAKRLKIPVIITVPITTPSTLHRSIQVLPFPEGLILNYPHEDVYHYCYYTPIPRNLSVRINWSNSSNDLDLYLYDSDGMFDVNSGNPGTENEYAVTSNTDMFRWFRIDAFSLLSVPLTFDINVSSPGNILPVIENVTDSEGINNGTVNDPVLIFYRPENITLNITYHDADNDTVDVTINDPGFMIVNESFNASDGRGSISFMKPYNDTMPRNSTISVTLTDIYGGITVRNMTLMLYSSILILSYSPPGYVHYIGENDSMAFTADSYEVYSNPLYYYWTRNGTLNSTEQNYTLNSSYLQDSEHTQNYTLELLISNNDTSNSTNETVSWMIIFDVEPPEVTIHSPAQSVHTYPDINISYDVSDDSPEIDTCMLGIYSVGEIFDGTNYSVNVSLDSCENTSLYLATGNYTMDIYAYDIVGNVGSSEVNFSVNDSTAPIISSISPSGTLAYTTSITLSVTTDENSTCRYDTNDTDYASMTSSFSDNVTAHTAAYGVGAGSYNIYVRCKDMSNNTNNISSNISFVINSPPVIDEGTEGNGGGGGGGGGGTYYAPGGDESVTGIIYGYDEGENEVSLEDEDIPIDRIRIDMNGSGNNTRFKITKTSRPDHNYSELVYAYLKVDAENLDMSQLKEALLFFEVETDWLILSNISKENVVLVRYDDISGNWTTLLTELLSESDNRTYYVSHTPGFGLFAISHNSSKSDGGMPVNMTPENITQEMKDNSSNIPTVLSGSGQQKDGDMLKRLADDLSEKINNLSLEWIIVILFGVFIFVFSLGIALRKQSLVDYKEDLISGADHAFRLKNNTVLEEKLPGFSSAARTNALNPGLRAVHPQNISAQGQGQGFQGQKTADKRDKDTESFRKLKSFMDSRKK